jgi:hypothetical protein
MVYLKNLKGHFDRAIGVELSLQVLGFHGNLVRTDAKVLRLDPKLIIHALLLAPRCLVCGIAAWVTTTYLVKVWVTLHTQSTIEKIKYINKKVLPNFSKS